MSGPDKDWNALLDEAIRNAEDDPEPIKIQFGGHPGEFRSGLEVKVEGLEARIDALEALPAYSVNYPPLPAAVPIAIGIIAVTAMIVGAMVG